MNAENPLYLIEPYLSDSGLHEAAIEAANIKSNLKQEISENRSRKTGACYVLSDEQGNTIARVPIDKCIKARQKLLRQREREQTKVIQEKKQALAKQWFSGKIKYKEYEEELSKLPGPTLEERTQAAKIILLLLLLTFGGCTTCVIANGPPSGSQEPTLEEKIKTIGEDSCLMRKIGCPEENYKWNGERFIYNANH